MNVLVEAADKQCNLEQMPVLKQELFATLKSEVNREFKTDLLSEVKKLLKITLKQKDSGISRKPDDDCISLTAPSATLLYDGQIHLNDKSSDKQFNSNSRERILAQDMKSLLSPPSKKQRL